jgi:CRISPR-associated protein Cas5h
MKPVIVFDLWGDYAHFRKYFTTTSPLTFLLPPRTALMGLIGAVCGLKKEGYIPAFAGDQAQLAVSIRTPAKKVRMAENLIDTKTALLMGKIRNRTQIRLELVKDPRYRVYVSLQNQALRDLLKEMLVGHKCVYTPYLGISELIANFSYVGEYVAEARAPDEHVNIVSALNADLIRDLTIEDNKEYFSEVMPCDMAADRSVTRYSKIVYERNGQAINARVTECVELEQGEFIAFM